MSFSGGQPPGKTNIIRGNMFSPPSSQSSTNNLQRQVVPNNPQMPIVQELQRNPEPGIVNQATGAAPASRFLFVGNISYQQSSPDGPQQLPSNPEGQSYQIANNQQIVFLPPEEAQVLTTSLPTASGDVTQTVPTLQESLKLQKKQQRLEQLRKDRVEQNPELVRALPELFSNHEASSSGTVTLVDPMPMRTVFEPLKKFQPDALPNTLPYKTVKGYIKENMAFARQQKAMQKAELRPKNKTTKYNTFKPFTIDEVVASVKSTQLDAQRGIILDGPTPEAQAEFDRQNANYANPLTSDALSKRQKLADSSKPLPKIIGIPVNNESVVHDAPAHYQMDEMLLETALNKTGKKIRHHTIEDHKIDEFETPDEVYRDDYNKALKTSDKKCFWPPPSFPEFCKLAREIESLAALGNEDEETRLKIEALTTKMLGKVETEAEVPTRRSLWVGRQKESSRSRRRPDFAAHDRSSRSLKRPTKKADEADKNESTKAAAKKPEQQNKEPPGKRRRLTRSTADAGRDEQVEKPEMRTTRSSARNQSKREAPANRSLSPANSKAAKKSTPPAAKNVVVKQPNKETAQVKGSSQNSTPVSVPRTTRASTAAAAAVAKTTKTEITIKKEQLDEDELMQQMAAENVIKSAISTPTSNVLPSSSTSSPIVKVVQPTTAVQPIAGISGSSAAPAGSIAPRSFTKDIKTEVVSRVMPPTTVQVTPSSALQRPSSTARFLYPANPSGNLPPRNFVQNPSMIAQQPQRVVSKHVPVSPSVRNSVTYNPYAHLETRKFPVSKIVVPHSSSINQVQPHNNRAPIVGNGLQPTTLQQSRYPALNHPAQNQQRPYVPLLHPSAANRNPMTPPDVQQSRSVANGQFAFAQASNVNNQVAQSSQPMQNRYVQNMQGSYSRQQNPSHLQSPAVARSQPNIIVGNNVIGGSQIRMSSPYNAPSSSLQSTSSTTRFLTQQNAHNVVDLQRAPSTPSAQIQRNIQPATINQNLSNAQIQVLMERHPDFFLPRNMSQTNDPRRLHQQLVQTAQQVSNAAANQDLSNVANGNRGVQLAPNAQLHPTVAQQQNNQPLSTVTRDATPHLPLHFTTSQQVRQHQNSPRQSSVRSVPNSRSAPNVQPMRNVQSSAVPRNVVPLPTTQNRAGAQPAQNPSPQSHSHPNVQLASNAQNVSNVQHPNVQLASNARNASNVQQPIAPSVAVVQNLPTHQPSQNVQLPSNDQYLPPNSPPPIVQLAVNVRPVEPSASIPGPTPPTPPIVLTEREKTLRAIAQEISQRIANVTYENIPGGLPDNLLSTWSMEQTNNWFRNIVKNDDVRYERFAREEFDGSVLKSIPTAEVLRILDLPYGPRVRVKFAIEILKEYEDRVQQLNL